MKKEVKNTVKTVKNVNEKLQLSKKLNAKIEKIQNFDVENASNWERLKQTGVQSEIATLGVNAVIKRFIKIGENTLTEGQKKVLTFENVITYIKDSKYSNLMLFTPYQAVLICNAVIKTHHKATATAERAKKQGAIVGKKADKVVKNSKALNA